MPEIDPSSIRNLVIVRLSAIGDVIHTLPCLHALRQSFPEARIGWLVEELSAPLLEGHPELDELYIIPKKRWRKHPVRSWMNGEKRRFYRHLRREPGWNVAIDFQGLTKSGWPARLSGAPIRIGYGDRDGREFNKLFTNRTVVPRADARHVIQRNLSLLEPLGVDFRKIPVEFRFPDFSEERARLQPYFQSLGADESGGFIALYPGAGWETKRWPVSHFAALARDLAGATEGRADLKMPIALIWGPGEEEMCRQIIGKADLPASRLTRAPRTGLRELAALLGRAAVVVGGDTGPVHLASALGRPVVGVFGGSDSDRNGVWGESVVNIESDSATCVRCWQTRCTHSTFLECLESITPERVGEAVRGLLTRVSGAA